MKNFLLMAVSAFALSACGGGAVDSKATVSDGARSTRSAAPQSSLSASPASLGLDVISGQSAAAQVTLQYAGTVTTHLQLTLEDLPAAFASAPVIQSLGGGRFVVQLTTAANLVEGVHEGALKFVACHQANCKHAAKTARIAVPYRITVAGANAGSDWQTHQGNAGHTGYVPVTLDPSRFQFAWEWRRTPGGVLGAINAVVSEGGKVFVTEDDYASAVSLHALNEADGSVAWKKDFGVVPGLNPPAVAKGMVYAATMGHQDTQLYAFRASDGTQVFQVPFESQWGHVLAPTVLDGRVYTNGGYYGGGVYAFDAASGARQWASFSGDDDMSTPAVDGRHAYHYSGLGLDVYAVADGSLVASIPDPHGPGFGYSYHAAPLLGSPDHVIAFSGGAFSGRASSSQEHYDSRRLVNFSVQAATTRWITQNAYLTHPALAKGVIYAGRNAPKSFDAISEATGQVLWSWTAADTDSEFHRNVVVTDNLAFVSTDRAVYAIDLQTRQAVWSYPVPGTMSLSASGMLYIAEGARESTGRLIAIKLR